MRRKVKFRYTKPVGDLIAIESSNFECLPEIKEPNGNRRERERRIVVYFFHFRYLDKRGKTERRPKLTDRSS